MSCAHGCSSRWRWSLVAFGFCFWQNHALLRLINSPLAHQTQQQVRDGHGPLGATYQVQRSARDVAVQLHAVVGVLRAPASIRARRRRRRSPAWAPASTVTSPRCRRRRGATGR